MFGHPEIKYTSFARGGAHFVRTTKNARFSTKIGTHIKFGTANSKIVVPSSKNCLGRGKKNEKEEKEEKTKNARIAAKIGTKINFGTANSKIVVPSSENLQKKVKKKKKKKKRKMLGSQRKLVPRSISVRRIQKLWSRVLKIFRRK